MDVVIPTLDESPWLASLISWLDGQGVTGARVLCGRPGQARPGWLRAEAEGFGPAVNAGVALGSSEFVLVLNDDLEPLAGDLSTLQAALAGAEWAFAAVPRLVTATDEGDVDESATGFLRRRGRPWPRTGREPAPSVAAYPNGAGFLVRRRAWEDLGGFDPSFSPAYWEDADLGLRAWARGMATWRVPEVAFRHHRGTTTGAWDRATLEGRFMCGQRLVSARHGRTLGLEPWWGLWEVASQARDLFSGRWRRLATRWGWR